MAKSKTLSLLDAFVTPQQVREMKGGLKFVRNVRT